VDRYYEIDHTQETAGQFSHVTNEWDLLTYLAQREGYDVYMIGRVLHFHPTAPADANPFKAFWIKGDPLPISNVIDLRLERALTLAKDIEVKVRSWNSKQGRGFERIARAIGAKSASAQKSSNQKGSETQRYVLIRPNLTEDQAQKLANTTLAELSAHERVISFAMPGEFELNARRTCVLSGTSSSWDQAYYIDSVQREVSFDGGFSQHVHAKNHSAQSEALV
jgi:phage protein D